MAAICAASRPDSEAHMSYFQIKAVTEVAYYNDTRRIRCTCYLALVYAAPRRRKRCDSRQAIYVENDISRGPGATARAPRHTTLAAASII